MARFLRRIHFHRIARWSLLALLVWASSLAVEIYRYSSIEDAAPADAAIVLGTEVWGDQPSPVFRERINHAVDLYKAGTVRALIFTGGVGIGGPIAESEVEREYALDKGVAAEHIYVETESRTTLQNLRGAQEIVEQRELGRVLIVSDPLHMKRAVLMARDLGLDAHPSPTPTTRYQSWKSQLRFLLREVYNLTTYLARRPFVSSQSVGKMEVCERLCRLHIPTPQLQPNPERPSPI
jgi:uncharacterized SAM-binding protein YcdF (DUF218 family)